MLKAPDREPRMEREPIKIEDLPESFDAYRLWPRLCVLEARQSRMKMPSNKIAVQCDVRHLNNPDSLSC